MANKKVKIETNEKGGLLESSQAYEYFADYSKRARVILRLQDWIIELSPIAVEEGSLARICFPKGRKFGTIQFGPGFWQGPLTEQRSTVVHELIHCHLAAMDIMIRDWADDVMGKNEADNFINAYTQAMEYGVDGLAEALAPLIEKALAA